MIAVLCPGLRQAVEVIVDKGLHLRPVRSILVLIVPDRQHIANRIVGIVQVLEQT